MTPQEQYQQHKSDLLNLFVDRHGLVLNRKVGSKVGQPDETWGMDHGDSAWRTGLAAICMAIEQDENGLLRFLKSLCNECWKDGRPIRHPVLWDKEPSTRYSRDQFYPQMAACYFAWKYGNDENAALAKTLLGRFIQVLRANDWRFNYGDHAWLTTPGQVVLREVARVMDLDHSWQPSIDDSVDKLETLIRRELKQALDEELKDIPSFLRDSVEDAAVPLISSLASLLEAIDDLADLPDPVRKLLPWEDRDSFWAGVFSYYVLLQGETIASQGDHPNSYYGIHNLFWNILLMYECRPQTYKLQEHTKRLYHACRKHNMAPLFWFRGGTAREVSYQWLENWPTHWNRIDYVWQRPKSSQDKARSQQDRKKPIAKLIPRLDYMILHVLHDVNPH